MANFEAVTKLIPELDPKHFFGLPESEQIQALSDAEERLQAALLEQARLFRGSVLAAIYSIALSHLATEQVMGKCSDILEKWSIPKYGTASRTDVRARVEVD